MPKIGILVTTFLRPLSIQTFLKTLYNYVPNDIFSVYVADQSSMYYNVASIWNTLNFNAINTYDIYNTYTSKTYNIYNNIYTSTYSIYTSDKESKINNKDLYTSDKEDKISNKDLYKNNKERCNKLDKSIFFHYFDIGFDKGTSYARNFLTEVVKEPICLIVDDDFMFDENTNFEIFLDFLEDYPDFDIVGGQLLKSEPYIYNLRFEENTLYYSKDLEVFEYKGKKVLVANIVPQCMFCRTSIFSDYHWDEIFHVFDHDDFFLNYLSSGKKVAYLDSFICIHNKSRPSSAYNTYRNRAWMEIPKFLNKWNIKEVVGHPYLYKFCKG